MYAVIRTGGKQYRVEPGMTIHVEKLEGEAGTTVQLKDRRYIRLRVSGFETKLDAKTFAAGIITLGNMPAPWVTCNIPGNSCQ